MRVCLITFTIGVVMDDHIKRALAEAEISGLIAEHCDVRDDIDAVRDAERAAMSLKDRCVRAAHLGMHLALRSVDGCLTQGVCLDAGDGYVVVSEGRSTRQLVPLAHVVEVHGLPDALAADPVKPPQLQGSIRSVLRRVPGPCRIGRVDGSQVSGLIAAVGDDHLEICTPDGRRCVVPLTAVTRTWWTQ
jgi:hypothetical protein